MWDDLKALVVEVLPWVLALSVIVVAFASAA